MVEAVVRDQADCVEDERGGEQHAESHKLEVDIGVRVFTHALAVQHEGVEFTVDRHEFVPEPNALSASAVWHRVPDFESIIGCADELVREERFPRICGTSDYDDCDFFADVYFIASLVCLAQERHCFLADLKISFLIALIKINRDKRDGTTC